MWPSKPRLLTPEQQIEQWESDCLRTLQSIIEKAPEPEKNRILRRIRAFCSGHITTPKKSAASSATFLAYNNERQAASEQKRFVVNAHTNKMYDAIASALAAGKSPIVHYASSDLQYTITGIIERRGNTVDCYRRSHRNQADIVTAVIDMRKLSHVE